MTSLTGIGVIALLLINTYFLYSGWERWREAVWPDGSEEDWLLYYANIINSVRRRPSQQKLSRRQIRVAGLSYVVLAVIGYGLAVLALLQAIV